jgi:hypothetical protein
MKSKNLSLRSLQGLLKICYLGYLFIKGVDIFEGLFEIYCKSALYSHAQMVFKFSACLVQSKNNYKVSACFFENTYTNSKDYSEIRIKFLFSACFFENTS